MKNNYSLLIAVIALLFVIQSKAQTNFKSLNYLYSISGTKTVAGIHNREPNTNPDLWTDSISVIAGKTPGLWSGDFLFTSSDVDARWDMIYEAEEQWYKGALINIMWHTCSPRYEEPCAWDEQGVLDSLSDSEWTDLITDGGTLNLIWKSRLDDIATYLQYLEDKGVEVFFRPFHEMNQWEFWWAQRPGPDGTVKLYQLTHDYLTNDKGLTNLIWTWDIQDYSTYATDLEDYNPGDSYWDVLALDMYSSDGTNYTTDKYNAFVNAANGKPIVIGECSKLPTSSELEAQPLWAFFMSWSELTVKRNTTAQIQDLYAASNVITLDEMDGWVTSVPTAPVSLVASGEAGQITLNWTDNSTNEGGFTIERSNDGVTFSQIATVDMNIITYTNTGLSDGETFYYRVNATNSKGASGYSNTVSATVQGTLTQLTRISATASSEYGTSYSPDKAIDDSLSTRWVSIHNPVDPQWITVDFGSLYSMQKIVLNWEGAYASSYTVDISTDNSNWITVKTNTAGSGGDETIDFTAQTARYLRVYCMVPVNGPYGYSLWEINAYGVESTPVTGVSVSPISSSISVSETLQLTATVSPSDATNQNVSWSSNDESVATVSSNGLVTGIAAGTAIITVTTEDGNKTATSLITVTSTETPLTRVSATASTQYSTSFSPDKAIDGSLSTRWVSMHDPVDPQWITVDFGSLYSMDKIILNWEGAYASSYTVDISTDNSNWSTIKSNTAGSGGDEIIDFTAQTARYVRVYCTVPVNGTWGYSLWEINAYGVEVTSSDLALNKTAIASSTFKAYYPGNAIDGDSSTEWRSKSSANPWIYVDLGATCIFNNVQLTWAKNYGIEYEIQVSDDASTWTTISTLTNQDGGTDNIESISGEGRYVRIYVTTRSNTNRGVHLIAFEVYGSLKNSFIETKTVQLSNISVFPNPATNVLNIKLGNIDSALLNIYSLDGRLIYKEKLRGNNVKIDVNSLNTKGIVIVKVSTETEISTFKVILE